MLGDVRDAGLGPDVKANYDDRGRSIVRLRRRGEQNVRFCDRSDTGPNYTNLDLFGRLLFERSLENLDRTLHVSLQNDEQFLDLGHTERFDTAFRGLEQSGLTGVHLTLAGDRLSTIDVRDDLKRIAGLRHALQPQYLDRRCRPGGRHGLAAI